MSKAILIMDMPKSCNECNIICTEYYELFKNGIEILVKPDGCPLKEMPQKAKYIAGDTICENAAKIGYNTCIEEILKGSE